MELGVSVGLRQCPAMKYALFLIFLSLYKYFETAIRIYWIQSSLRLTDLYLTSFSEAALYLCRTHMVHFFELDYPGRGYANPTPTISSHTKSVSDALKLVELRIKIIF